MLILPWIALMAGVFYLLIWRPQQRRVSTMRALQGSLQLGDEVITTAGLYGTIAALRDEYIELEIAPNTVIKLARGAIGQCVTNFNDDAPDNDVAPDHPYDGTGGLEETG